MAKKKINKYKDARFKRQPKESIGDFAARKGGWHSKKYKSDFL